MKTIRNNFNLKKQIGEYSSIDEILSAKMENATETLNKFDLKKLNSINKTSSKN